MIRTRRNKPCLGRLKGEAMAELRWQCFERDGWRCQHLTLVPEPFGDKRDEGRTFFYKTCGKLLTWETGHMAHIVSRARGGKDELSNVTAKCQDCHIGIEHAYGPSGVKPVPAKDKP